MSTSRPSFRAFAPHILSPAPNACPGQGRGRAAHRPRSAYPGYTKGSGLAALCGRRFEQTASSLQSAAEWNLGFGPQAGCTRFWQTCFRCEQRTRVGGTPPTRLCTWLMRLPACRVPGPPRLTQQVKPEIGRRTVGMRPSRQPSRKIGATGRFCHAAQVFLSQPQHLYTRWPPPAPWGLTTEHLFCTIPDVRVPLLDARIPHSDAGAGGCGFVPLLFRGTNSPSVLLYGTSSPIRCSQP